MNGRKKKSRSEEISEKYFEFLDRHIDDVISARTADFMGLHQIASELGISHKHLINVIQHEFGNHPSYFYDFRIIKITKEILLKEDISIAEVARKFTYDPSNFSKFFKSRTGQTPGSFRRQNKNKA
ncbi:helix-turn-helix domain-containing protein [Chryseobacterium bernardetii]|uniref:helix-turn-helix domain-containing protein n=1 Tax=Chryseobacterium bernardetii TaxID=1241978 RepID=UPI000F4EC7AD|nr:helix-turn-helix domain-containing protein [Chryseobacterium bernardetii]AZB33373.1 AraC family transcriptional regulator [Chryseobacterium bernardetii]